MLQIRLLGQFDVRLDGKRVLIPSRPGQSLLAYLVLTGGTAHRREKLAGILWPDTSDETARKNLRHELWRIRKAIASAVPAAGPYVLAEEFTIAFNRDADYWLDAAQLERPETDLESLSSNLAQYQGELLPGFYDDWVALERERVQSLFDAKMEQLLEQLITAQRWMAVQEQAERWLSLGNAVEPAYRALMLAYGARGDMAQVSSLYQRCMDVLDEKFGLEPSAETRALYEGLLKGTQAPVRPAVQPSSTVTFLFTDIEGSTHLLDQLGDQYAAILAEHHEVLRAAIEKWNGREVDTQGDAFFVTFPRALAAVQCAAEIQRTMASHAWPHGQPLRVRMGLHTGEPLLTSIGYVGMDVHRAARIGDAAHGGQVLLSQTTRELVARELPSGLAIRDLGEHRLKDLKYPAQIFQLVIEGVQDQFPPLRTKFSGMEPPTPGEPPFKGLQFFDEIDSDLFFGRELLTARLVSRLNEGGFLSVIVGASGSGKSSLVRAGLIPALKKGEALIDGIMPPKGSAGWRVHIIVPTAHPLQALAIELTRDSESVTAAATLMDDLLQDPRSLSLYLARQSAGQHVLLALDQFEELFTLCRDEFEREAFIDNLLTAVSLSSNGGGGPDFHGQVTLILTLRADFYAHLAQYPELREAVAHRQEYIGPMNTEELRRAIEEPAKRGNWAFEPGLVDLLLRDVGDEPGALPLLSHALLETWKRRAGHTLTLQGYADAGGVQGAIAHTAESVYQSLPPDQQAMARDIFLRLTELGEGTEDTRRRASFDELLSHAGDPEAVRSLLNRLADARLVTLAQDTAEVAHEALIRGWPTLQEWLAQDRESLRLHRRLTEAAHEWELLERDAGALYRGSHLAQARDWAASHSTDLNAGEKAFLVASEALEHSEIAEREAQQQRELEAAQNLAQVRQNANTRLRRRAFFLVGALGIALAMAFAALSFGRQARANFLHADALRLAAEANKLLLGRGNNADLIALLSLRSMKMQYSPQGDAALEGAMTLVYPLRVFTGSTADLASAAYSPDGKYILTGGIDMVARLWDAQTGREIRQFTGHTHWIYGAAFSPDGKQIATASFDQTVRLWDPQTGKLLRVLPHPAPVKYVVFTPDGKYLITGSGPYGHQEWVWDAATGRILRSFSQSTGLYAFDVSRDGKYLLTGGKDDVAHLWDVQTGAEIRQYAFPVSVNTLTFSPDGQSMIMSGWDTFIRFCDIHSGQILRTIDVHESLQRLVYSPDGKYILLGGGTGDAQLLDAQTGEQLAIMTGHENSAYGVLGAVFSPDGRYIFTAGGKIGQLWETEQVVHTGLPEFVSAEDPVYEVAFSPDGRTLAITHASEKGATIWDLRTKQKVREYSGLSDYVFSLTFSPDGRFLLAGGGNQDNTVRLWDVQTGQELHRFTWKGDQAGEKAVFSPDGKYVASFSQDGHLLETGTGREVSKFIGHSDVVWGVAFSPDGRYLVSGSRDATARLWDTQTGQQLHIFKLPTNDEVDSVAFSPDSKEVLTGSDDGLLRLWDVQSGKELREFTGHTLALVRVAFSPDGRYALSASYDGTARLWDIATGAELRRFVGHVGSLDTALFSPDGKYVVTGGDDGVTRFWFTDYQDEIQYLCARLPRDFTDDERRQYNITGAEPTCPAH